MVVKLPILSRVCGDCTKCCEGWLEGVVHGYKMFRGCSCHFLEKTCSVYEHRPENPCKSYNCAWLKEDQIPMWMKPNLSNVIMTKLSTRAPTDEGMRTIEYYDIIEAGSKLDAVVLNWLINWAIDNKLNIAYELDGKVHAMGDSKFKELFCR